MSGSPSAEGWCMAFELIHCPTCDGGDVVKHGKTSDGKQRFRCQNPLCESVTFLRTYTYQGLLPEVKRRIIDMSLNGSGIRDIARVLHMSGSSTGNRGHEHHRSTRSCKAREGRPRRLAGVQRGGGT
jgi:transposase-like protein